MEQFLECYLAEFKEAPRNSLHDRRNRKQMVEYINTLIQGCAGVNNDDTNQTCREAIRTLIQYHNKAKSLNGSVCMMGKNHNILYVAMKLCYLWQMQDAELVCQLLRNIYSCEGTFERIFIGTIFGTKAPHFIAGWKSDFEDEEENIRGVVYFLDKTNRGRLILPFLKDNVLTDFRFVDLPIESCGKASCVKICVQLGLPDRLLILLRFGALIDDPLEQITCLQHILKRLMEFNHCYPYNLVACLQLILRIIPTVSLNQIENNIETTNKALTRHIIEEQYSDLIQDGLIPCTRYGHSPPELKHLCRCCVRYNLWKNFTLPHGIRQLQVPDNIMRYLDILTD